MVHRHQQAAQLSSQVVERRGLQTALVPHQQAVTGWEAQTVAEGGADPEGPSSIQTWMQIGKKWMTGLKVVQTVPTDKAVTSSY